MDVNKEEDELIEMARRKGIDLDDYQE